jgi:hypothetical protein
MAIEFHIDASKLEDAIRGNAEEYLKRAVPALQSAAKVVQAEAKRRAPVDTGLLEKSIKTRVAMDGSDVVAQIGTNVEYAIHVEYGHRIKGRDGKILGYAPGRYFLKGALDSQRVNVLRVISRRMGGK